MVRKISPLDALASFGDVLDSVSSTREPVIVEEKGRPVAVIISPELSRGFRRKMSVIGRSLRRWGRATPTRIPTRSSPR
jgi:prevent-host-death family protein